jgi:hypothetical protein
VQITPAGGTNNVTGYIHNNLAYMPDGTRPAADSLMHTNNGSYRMQDSGPGVLLPTVNVTIPGVGQVAAYTDNGYTYMLGGNRPGEGYIVHTQNGDWTIKNGQSVRYVPPVVNPRKTTTTYATAHDAARAFAVRYHQRSLDERQEYGAVIVQDANGRYRSVNVTNSTEGATQWGQPVENFRTETYINRDSILVGSTAVATIHTHWDPNGSLNFSHKPEDDMGDYAAEWMLNEMFLVNREGEVYYSKRSSRTMDRNNRYGFSVGVKLFSIK